MTDLDELIDEIAERYELGAKGRALVQEVLSLIAAQPGAIDGFLDRVKAAGLENKVDSWLAGPYPMALSAREVKKALGAEDIDRIAKNAGLTRSIASRVLGYAIPKTVVLLTQGRATPGEFPLLSFHRPAQFSSPRIEEFTVRREGRVMLRKMEGGGYAAGLRLVIPGAALIITLGLFGYAISSGTAGDGASIPLALKEALNAPVASPQTPSMPSYLLAGNENGAAATSGSGGSEGNSAALPGSIKTLLGSDAISGDFAVKAGWIKNLSIAFDGSWRRDPRMPFAGNAFSVGGAIAQTDARVPRFVAAEMTGGGSPNMRIALSPSNLGSSGKAPVRVLNQALIDFRPIYFPANSAEVPPGSLHLLRRTAEQIKQLPRGTMVQLKGYTHSTGSSAADLELSQRRADSVYRILVRDGVSPAILSAKGYGGAPLAASTNGPMEGRSSTMTEMSRGNDRCVDFSVVPEAQ